MTKMIQSASWMAARILSFATSIVSSEGAVPPCGVGTVGGTTTGVMAAVAVGVGNSKVAVVVTVAVSVAVAVNDSLLPAAGAAVAASRLSNRPESSTKVLLS